MQLIYKGIANLFSILFHPLFIIIYVLGLFLIINPYLFPYRNGREFGAIFLVVFFTAVLIPMVAILLLYGTGFIRSLKMEENTERIGPLMVAAVSYLWLFLNIRTHNAIPVPFSAFVLGALISICIAFFINNFHKISLHSIGMGGLFIALCHVIVINGRAYSICQLPFNLTLTVHNVFLIALLIVISGVVVTSRLYLNAHNIRDVAGGLLVGIAGQIIALKFF